MPKRTANYFSRRNNNNKKCLAECDNATQIHAVLEMFRL